MSKTFDQAYRKCADVFGSEITPNLRDVIAHLPPKAHVFEIGCGQGRDTMHLLLAGLNVAALDSSSPGIEQLVNNAESAGLSHLLDARTADVRDISAWPASFEGVVAVTLFDHLPAAESWQIFSECAQRLEYGGLIFACVHTVDDPGFTQAANMSEFGSEIAHYFKRNELVEFALRSSLHVLSYQETIEVDLSHGPRHKHGFAYLTARKE